MLQSKADVDKHVSGILSKIQNENEKKNKCYNIARLYYNVKDYETAKRYICEYLSIREHHAPSHKLLAQIYEGLGNLEKALQSYKRSLEIDSSQKEIVIKICALYSKFPVDHETAKYWADRGDKLFPHNEIVFRLRESIVSENGYPARQELENLIKSELVSQPSNLSLTVKLLRLYLENERINDAYEHAVKIENKMLFPYQKEWYSTIVDVFEAYHNKPNQELDPDFYMMFLSALDRLVYLMLVEPHVIVDVPSNAIPSSIDEVAIVLLQFDQLLKKATKKELSQGPWLYFLHHMKGQLYFHLGTLLLKKAKKDHRNWNEACQTAAALFLVGYSFKPSNLLQEIWFNQMDEQQKLFTSFFQQGALRTNFIGHVIIALCEENKGKWLQKIKNEICLPQVQERIFNRLFGNAGQKLNVGESYFLNDNTFVNSSLEYPELSSLQEYNEAAYKLCVHSLHYLVWLHLHKRALKSEAYENNLNEAFKNLQFGRNNLSNGSPESVCFLDLEAFLLATVYTTELLLEQKYALINNQSSDMVLQLPPDISDRLCSEEQANWWRAVHGLINNTIKEKLGDHRCILQRGLEVIRGIGNHGLEVQLLVYLARTFGDKASALRNDDSVFVMKKNRQTCYDKVSMLESRAVHYWNIVIVLLDKLDSKQSLRVPKDRMFIGLSKPLSKEEIVLLKEEGKLYLACHYMNNSKLEKAVGILEQLSSPYASYYLALCYKKLAFQEPVAETAKVALLQKARDALYVTMDRIRNDAQHSLNNEIHLELEDVENEIGKNANYLNSTNNNDSEGSDSYSTPVSSFLSNTCNGTLGSRFRLSSEYHTPRPSSNFITRPKYPNESTPNKTMNSHLPPSPERLDAQLRYLNITHTTVLNTVVEQQRCLQDSSKVIMETMKSMVEQNKINTDILIKLNKKLDEISISCTKPHQSRPINRRPPAAVPSSHVEEASDDYESNSCLDYYVDEDGDHYRPIGYDYGQSRTEHSNSSLSYLQQSTMSPATHYAYQYPPPPIHHPNLPPIPDTSHYYPPAATPINGLPLNEGQPLPQFRFHMPAPVVKSSVMPVPPPFVPRNLQQPPVPTILPPHSSQPPVPWTKPSTCLPHAFQIPLPVTTVAVASSMPFVQTTAVTSSMLISSIVETPKTTSATKAISSDSPILLKALLHGSPPNQILDATSTPNSVNNSLDGFSFQTNIVNSPEVPVNRSYKDSEAHSDTDVEKEVMGDFKPVIPLPAEVIVKTGEEDETALFEDHAKLYRFIDKEWKERGTGVIKILKSKINGDIRLLMRRDQVHKICANHKIVSSMDMQYLKNSEKALTWVAHDFSEGTLKPEQFCIRFKQIETAKAFLKAFQDAVLYAKLKEKSTSNTLEIKPVVNNLVSSATEISSGFGAQFRPKPGSWSCNTCYVVNDSAKLACAACLSPKPAFEQQKSAVSSSNLPMPVTAINEAVRKPQMSAGDTSKWSPSSLDLVPKQLSTPSTKSALVNFTFTLPEKSTVSKPEVKQSESRPVFEDFAPALSQKDKFESPTIPILGGFTFSSVPVIKETPKESPDRQILVVSTKSKDGPQVTKLDSIKTSPFTGFSFNFNKSSPGKGESKEDSSVFSPFSNNTSIDLTNKQGNKFQSDLQRLSDSPFSPVASDNQKTSEASEGIPEEFVPTAEFKPVIPLPALVNVQTGEEGEEKLFGERAKLFRYDPETKEWKERGLGEIKILHSLKGDKYRIVMRRDQVLKVCANHYIQPGMKLVQFQSNEKSWIWRAKDFSDGELKDEQFAIRFKTTEIAKEFKKTFEKCCQLSEAKKPAAQTVKDTSKHVDPCSGNQKGFGDMFKPKVNSWECKMCYVRNEGTSHCCIACNSPKPGSKTSEEIVSSKKDDGFWECLACHSKNVSIKSTCAVCDAPKGSKETPIKPATGFANFFKSDPIGWECTSCRAHNDALAVICGSCQSNKPSGFGTFTFGVPTSETSSSKSNAPSGFVFGSKSDPSTFSSVKFGAPPTETKSDSKTNNNNSGFLFGAKTDTSSLSNFTFGASSLPFSSVKSNFGVSESVDNKPVFGSATSTDNVTTSNSSPFAAFSGFTQSVAPSSPFSVSNPVTSSTSTISNTTSSAIDIPKAVSFKFGAEIEDSSKGFEFRFGSPHKYEFNFSGVQPRSPPKSIKSPRSPGTPSDVADEEEVEPSDADNIYFSPVIPLPPKIEVKTGEEDETVLFTSRAKLFRFSEGEWKERGIGAIKILYNESRNTIRLLMRRDQVLKVCLNHFLTNNIVFTQKDEKSITWAAIDYSENEPILEKFAMRFKTKDLATQFYNALENAKKQLQKSSDEDPTARALNFSDHNLSDVAEIGSEEYAEKLSSFSFNLDSGKTKPFDLASRLGVSPTKSPSEKYESDSDIEIVYENNATPEQIAKAKELMLPPNFFTYVNKPPCPGCRGCKDDSSGTLNKEKKDVEKKNVKDSRQEVDADMSIFSNSSVALTSFATIANQGQDFTLNKTNPGSITFEGAGQQLFGGRTTQQDGEEVENPDIHFEPIIPLPDLVDVKTGEEDEDPIFSHRSKLYCFDTATSQWKERGIGDIKILKHKERCRYRLLLRRDQVYKIACNHLITEDMELTPLKTSETSLCWFAVDYTEGQPERAQFAVKFKNKEIMENFKAKFDEAKAILANFKKQQKSSSNETFAALVPDSSEPTVIQKEEHFPSITMQQSVNESLSGIDSSQTVDDDNEEYQYSDEEEEDDDDEDYEDDTMFIFDKRVSFEFFNDEKKKYEACGMGSLQVTYDDGIFGYRIKFINDENEIVSDHIIAIQTCLRTNDRSAMWAAIDISIDPPKKRQFRATFSSIPALSEFSRIFEEGKEAAVHAEIVENSDSVILKSLNEPE